MPQPRLLACSALVAALASVPAVRAQAPGGLAGPRDREVLFHEHSLPPGLLVPPRPAGLQDEYDVVGYDLSLWLDVANARLEGANRIVFTPLTDPFPVLELDLESPSMELLGVEVLEPSATVATSEHVDGKLRITLDPPLTDLMSPAIVLVRYQGSPRQLSFGTMTFSQHGDPAVPLIYSLSEPNLARGWWPCKDRPDDKALVAVHVEAPDELVVVSNGVEGSRVPGRAGHAITTWSSRYPIATYLVAVSATDYATWTEDYETLDPLTAEPVSMPISFWSWPEKLDEAREDWSVALPMMEFFSDAYGEYPFLDEKYGHVMIRLSGAMEHQTCTSYGVQLVRGDHRFDFVVAHELAHQWWGDLVSPGDFDSIWLNEGFASWSEAFWFENAEGWDRYHDYMVRNLVPRGTDFPGTVHAPDEIFNDTVYDKGAWVLHMLRWVLGQPSERPSADALLEALRAWSRAFPYRSGRTEDFTALVSDRTGPLFGAPLAEWFFPQWLYREGRPSYEVGWSAAPQSDGTWRLHLRVAQTQAGEPYAMPVQVRIELPSGTVEELVWNDRSLVDYEWLFDEAPTAVAWDPDDWVLKFRRSVSIDSDRDGWPDWLDGCPAVPNPAQEDLDGDGTQDACQEGLDFDGDGRLNEDDCAPADGEVWLEPADDTLLFVTREPGSGLTLLRFEQPDPSGQRAFVANVSRGDLGLARQALAPEDALCFATAVAGTEWRDDLPSDSAYYLVFPAHGCTRPPEGPVATADPCR